MYCKSTSCCVHAAGSSAGRLSSATAGIAAEQQQAQGSGAKRHHETPVDGSEPQTRARPVGFRRAHYNYTMNVMRFEADGRQLPGRPRQPRLDRDSPRFRGTAAVLFRRAARRRRGRLRAGSFVGDTRAGGSCNCEILTLAPHCNGTHTECVGHVTDDRVAVSERVPGGLQLARLVTRRARRRGRVGGRQRSGARRRATAWSRPPRSQSRGSAGGGRVRRRSSCAHRRDEQPLRAYRGPAPAPYLSRQAAAWLVDPRHRDAGARPAVGRPRRRRRPADRAPHLLRPAARLAAGRRCERARARASRSSPGSTPASRTACTCSTCRCRRSSRTRRRRGRCSIAVQRRMSAELSLEAARARDARIPRRRGAPSSISRARPDGARGASTCAATRSACSRGARPRTSAAFMGEWQRLGVLGYHDPEADWLNLHERLAPTAAALAGARPLEAVVMNSLTINLHLLMASFYRPTRERHVILIEQGAFPSDRYAVVSQIGWHGLDPRDVAGAGRRRAPASSCCGTRTSSPRSSAWASRLALVLLPGVQYLTGQRLDIAGARCGRASRRRSRRLRPCARDGQPAALAARLGRGFRGLVLVQVPERRAGRDRRRFRARAALRQRPRRGCPAGGATTSTRRFEMARAVPAVPRRRRLAGEQPPAARHGAAAGVVCAVRGGGPAGAARALARADRLARDTCWRRASASASRS